MNLKTGLKHLKAWVIINKGSNTTFSRKSQLGMCIKMIRLSMFSSVRVEQSAKLKLGGITLEDKDLLNIAKVFADKKLETSCKSCG